ASSFAPRLGVDGLSALFLATLGLIAAPALVFSLRYLQPTPRGRLVGTLTSAFLLALALVVCARDPFTFLAGWELMTLLSGAVILVARGADREARQTVFSYLAVTHLGGVGTWVAILLLAQAEAIGNPAAIGSGSGLQAAIALAALLGMGTKAGVMPLHVWLPRAHPLAPAPVSALMSGVMIKVALYGLIRVLVEWDGVLPVWLGVVVLAVGALSAVGGVVYALFQHDLKRLLALHSIENVGIIVLGIGACLVLRARGADAWAAFAFAAALLHTVNHAVFKALLFLGAGVFERAVGSLEIDRLGGLLRRMPWAGGAFLVGAMAIAGLPPLNGFASEWLTLQALLHVAQYGDVADGVAGAIALAALGATAALAVFCFVKVVGLVLLGPPRTPAAAAAQEPPLPLRAALLFLAGTCVVLGAAPGLLFGTLVGLAPWAGAAPTHAGLQVPGTGSLPTVAIAVLLLGTTAALAVLRGRRSAAPAPTWACGQLVEPALRWTSAGFTKPLRLVLEAVLRPQREIAVRSEGGVLQEVSYSGHVPQLIDDRLYGPVTRFSLAAAGHARRLQSGSLGTYVAYLIALVLVLLAAARLGVIG
ncbi:MAG: proton-conducting transporter transmembrane domain-containing protein, partial [Gaiellaceae bacterium]